MKTVIDDYLVTPLMIVLAALVDQLMMYLNQLRVVEFQHEVTIFHVVVAVFE